MAGSQRAAGQSHGAAASSGFPAGRKNSETCYLSWREVLEVVEGEVGDQVSGVPDDGWGAEGDGGRAQSFAVPQTKGLTPVQAHTPQVPVNGFYTGEETDVRLSVEQTSAFVLSSSVRKDRTGVVSRTGVSLTETHTWVSASPLMTANTFTL